MSAAHRVSPTEQTLDLTVCRANLLEKRSATQTGETPLTTNCRLGAAPTEADRFPNRVVAERA